MRRTRTLALALLLGGASSAVAGSRMRGVEDGPSSRPIVKLGSAEEQLRFAVSLRTAGRGLDGDARSTNRREAARAFRAVREHFPSDVGPASEAAFRAGELLRAAGDAQGALEEFTWVREHAGDAPFRLRAVLEIGHVHRRARRPQEALAAYEALFSDTAASKRQKDDASLWIGSVCAAVERYDDARRAWQRVAEGGEDPLDRIRAFDHLALHAVDRGDLEGSAGLLERCRAALEDVAEEETRLGERVRTALSEMRAHDVLQRAVADRERARAKPKKEPGM